MMNHLPFWSKRLNLRPTIFQQINNDNKPFNIEYIVNAFFCHMSREPTYATNICYLSYSFILISSVVYGGWWKAKHSPYKHAIAAYGAATEGILSQIAYGSCQKICHTNPSWPPFNNIAYIKSLKY
jgi:hypothetical protein